MRENKKLKGIAVYMALSLLFEIFFPTMAMALTGGPAQPESSSFEPVGTSDMVDLFSGDYNYNIPLMDVGGYPVNISYHSGISMDQEASWTGLGWNINPGAINRNMRGLPDDFNGDKVIKEFNIKPNQTYGANVGFGFELAGFDALKLNFSIGIKYNNYNGMGIEKSANLAISAGQEGSAGATASLGLKSSDEGLDVSPSFSATTNKQDSGDRGFGASIGTSFNSRSGLKALTIGVSYTASDGGMSTTDLGIGSTEISFVNPTYIPTATMSMVNKSVTGAFQIGATVFTVNGTANFAGYFSEQKLAQKRIESPAYGYLYSENGLSDDALLDFNREKDGAFNRNTPALPLTNHSYDLYAVSGQGVGGQFRPYRSDLGFVFDSRNTTTSLSSSVGVEVTMAQTAGGGGDVTVTDVNSSTGKWVNNNAAASALRFKGPAANNTFEPYYFKQVGEKNVDDYQLLYDQIGKDAPVRIKLQQSDWDKYGVVAKNVFQVGESYSPSEKTIPAQNYRSKRQKRNQLFSFINRGEYVSSAIDKSLSSSISAAAKGNHIAEITTIKTDGSRYIYGIPAYNTHQEEVTFRINNSGGYDADRELRGLASYGSSANTTGNTNGIDNYYSNTTLPSYAHSYLLTAVLSADYVDITGDGPSVDDYGTYSKFSYTNVAPNYRWRVPYEYLKANFSEGLKTVKTDEAGSYIYGEKEIWILKKIESKNYVAIFTLKNRADGFDVQDKNGGIGSNTSPLLKKISLYSRPDFEAGAPSVDESNNLKNVTCDAAPIKEVHFVYDYSLCKNTLNNVLVAGGGSWAPDLECEAATNEGGKLTLKQLYFTYGNSNKAKLNPYTFIYPNGVDDNPDYDMKDYDKWGNYKPNDGAGLSNADDPYAIQDKALADTYAAAWCLKTVKLPSGGEINVDYESDDYAYVQDKRAMQMFKVTGVGVSDNVDPETGSKLSNSCFMYFRLQEPILVAGANDNYISAHYLKGISTDLYFRFLMDINVNGSDYVPGYAQNIWNSGFVKHAAGIVDIEGAPHYTHGYIQLRDVDLGDSKATRNVSPITKAAIQFARMNTPKEAFNQDGTPTSMDVEEVLRSLTGVDVFRNTLSAFMGANGTLFNLGYGQKFTPHKSFLRLTNPNYKKLGGGVRVKRITISDKWGEMQASSDPTKNFSYGQEYAYTKVEGGIEISSGVTPYEPLVGGDESPFRLPVAFREELKLVADLDHYQEKPYGESFFPGAGVGYSRVTVKNLQHDNVKRHATGSVVTEFYTARDFPVFTKRTTLDAQPRKTGILAKLLSLNIKEYMTASQGFSIELNDMHGKPKATKVYAEDQIEPISGVEYKYKRNGNKLDNNALVIDKNGNAKTEQVGLDYDFVADMRESETTITNSGIQVNVLGFLVLAIPIVVPPIWPTYSNQETRFRSASTTKVINRYGLLEETIAYDLGSKVSTKNLAYDSETGEVILTKTKNDFDDEIYSLNYPAHLAYDRMGPAYKNVGYVLNTSGGSSVLSSTGQLSDSHFVPGDELQISPAPIPGQSKYWVAERTSGNAKYIVGKNGEQVSFGGACSIKIIRSGRRNQQGLSVGSFTSLVNPISNAALGAFDESYNVLNASATEYAEEWRTFCECGVDPDLPGNKYVLGILGNWRAKKSYTFLADRRQTKSNNNSNIRKDGTLNYFNQFWSKPTTVGGNWSTPADLYSLSPNWTWTSEVTEYSPYGPELENKDALNRYSAAIYGYNNSLPIAVGSNTKYRQIANDNFEDYDFDDCADDHFSFERAVEPVSSYTGYKWWLFTTPVPGIVVDNNEAHSGKSSLRLAQGKTASITKVIERCSDLPAAENCD